MYMRDQQSTEGNITEAPFAGDEQVAILEAFLLAEKIYAAYKDEGNQVVADLTERFLRDYPVELLTELLEEIGRSEQVGLVWSSVNTGQ